MKKLLPLLALVAAILLVGRTLMPPKNPTAFNLQSFGELPVLVNGRVKPLDTVARTSLLQLQRRQAVKAPPASAPLVAAPVEWLAEVAFRPEKADTFPTFYIDHPDVLALIGKTEDNLKITYEGVGNKIRSIMGGLPSRHNRFSLQELQPHIGAIQAQARLADKVESAIRTPFQRAVLQLYGNLVHYQRLRHAFVSPGRDDFLGELLKFQDNVAAGVAAVRAKQAGQSHDEAAVNAMTEIGERFVVMAESTTLLVIPPDTEKGTAADWKSAGATLLETFRTGRVNASALAYAGLAHAWRNNQPEQFNKLLELFHNDIDKKTGPQLEKIGAETRFNHAQPFASARGLFILAFFLAVFSWLVWPQALRGSAFWFIAVGWVVMTAGIAARMWIEGRPPVTNLYSSALFVGWGSVGLCLILEYFFRNAIASAAAGAIGFASLQIAGHLELSGDTMEMMRAVLDSNFWLATHVVVVTAGYSATFLAGFLAIIYVVRGVFTRTLDKVTGDSLARMVYGIVCFATLFSFVGTILGGIWADQSWGRFWGWDPKENGALLIVMWNAIILHARWGGMIKQRGLMTLAIGGNIITSWSWFGTNMLGVGLHSYGFTDAAFVTLSSFVVSQLVLIGVGCLPLTLWRSFKTGGTPVPAKPEHVEDAIPAK
jgi:ABC-type transport system involved in cytochrome c biogenesis permease subunit